MSQELVPQDSPDSERPDFTGAEVPVDVTVHRKEVLGVFGDFALTRTKVRLSRQGSVKRDGEDPEKRTVDGAIALVGPTTLRIHVWGPDEAEPKQIEGSAE